MRIDMLNKKLQDRSQDLQLERQRVENLSSVKSQEEKMNEQKFTSQLDLLKQENGHYHSLLEQQHQVYTIMKTEHQNMAQRIKESEEENKAACK